MHLVPCIRPEGSLEPAPVTSLGEAAADERWEGFWSIADERHYTRCTTAAGRECWYRIADLADVPGRSRRREARIIPFPVRVGRAPRMIVGRYRGSAMLVGTRHRRARATAER